MNNIDIDKSFISDEDKFLFEFDARHQKSESQLKEIAKHKRISELRDNAKSDDKTSK